MRCQPGFRAGNRSLYVHNQIVYITLSALKMDKSGKYFYRCYSNSSAGGLISGKGRRHGRQLGTDLRAEFVSHVLDPTMEPTALISASNRLIDTLQRAFSKFYNNGEIPDQIWIAFIYVPDEDKHIYHHAEDLAKKWNYPNPGRLRYEYIFEWEIPARYLIHKVSVETLITRGFDMNQYLLDYALPPTSILRKELARRILEPSHGGYHIGFDLGHLARCFGARAPVRQLALQLLRDCSHVRCIDDNTQTVIVSYVDNQIDHLDFSHFCDIEDGIDTALYDWWLADPDFFNAYEEHRAWASQIENDIKGERKLWLDGDIGIEEYEKHKQQADTIIKDAAISLGL
jgi:hypothetical protein